MRNKINKIAENLKLIFSWEFLAIFIYNLAFFILYIKYGYQQNRYDTTIYYTITWYSLFFLPLIIFIIYKFSTNQKIKSFIEFFFNSKFQSAKFSTWILIISTITAFIFQLESNYLSKWFDIVSYTRYIFTSFWILSLSVALYQLFTKQWEKSVVTFGLLILIGILFFIFDILLLFIEVIIHGNIYAK